MTEFQPAVNRFGTEGHNQAPASAERAERRIAEGITGRVQGLIIYDLVNQYERGRTCHEAERDMGISHESYSGARTSLHRRGDIVRLAEKRDKRHVYVMPDQVGDRETVPFRANGRQVPPEVLAAADRAETTFREIELGIVYVDGRDLRDLATLIDFARTAYQ